MLRLEVEVGKPERVGDYRNGFVMFPVITKLAELPRYKKDRTSLARCVSDFLAFRQLLIAEFPGLIIPPLSPELSIDMYHRLSELVLEKRREELETFLIRLISIPDIKVSDSLLAFLQSPSWTSNVKARHDDVFADLMKRITSETGALVGKFIGDSYESEGSKFNALMGYVNEFGDTLNSITTLTSVLLRSQQEMGCDYQKLGTSLTKLGKMETDLQHLVSHLSMSLTAIGTIYLDQAFRDNAGIIQSLKQYIDLSKTLQNVLKHRTKLVNEYYGVLMEIRDAKVELTRLQDQLINNPVPQRKTGLQYFNYLVEDPFSKIQKLQTKIDAAEIELVKKKEKMTDASDKIMKQISQFDEWKHNDFKMMFLLYIQNQIDFHSKAKKAWQSVLSTVVSTSNNAIDGSVQSPTVNGGLRNSSNHIVANNGIMIAPNSHSIHSIDEQSESLSSASLFSPPMIGDDEAKADLDDDNVVDQDYLSSNNDTPNMNSLVHDEQEYTL